ncbi:hypothetical protein TNCV_3396041 [Trichonephila clavipes]|nr:hypothetical protein TNCV_3396041 [Trichonephila clavipes]
MLYKHQTIKVTTTCVVWMMTRLVVSVVTIVGYNHYHTSRHRANVSFVSKHNAVRFHLPSPQFNAPLVAQNPVASSQEKTKQWTPCGHSILLQTASNGTSGHRMMRNILNLLYYGS